MAEGRDDDASDMVTRMLQGPRPRDAVDERRALARVERELLGVGTAQMRLSRYLLLDQLGAGGGGIVYSAYDPELERKVAIKLLHAGGVGDEGSNERTSRLTREAQALARIAHPNVIAVHDVGTYGLELAGGPNPSSPGHAHGGVFVVMELVDGETLRAWIRARSHGWRQVLEVFLPAGRGLAAAHAAGMTHRDFKPANVLIGKDGRVRVLDFGLARVASTGEISDAPDDRGPAGPVDEDSSGRASADPLTRSGAVLGTPAYMAPEQHRGETADERSDQYGFCVALYEALYGRRPFVGATLDELRAAKESGPPAAPADAGVPAHVAEAVQRGLSADPGGRFASMNALLDQLAADPALRRRRILLAAGGLALVVGLGYAVAGWVQARSRICDDQGALLAGVWDDGARDRARASFLATNTPYARPVWEASERMLDEYTSRWIEQRHDSCRASLIDEVQSRATMDQQYACLDRRRRALEELLRLFSAADAALVEQAPQAIAALPAPEDCNDPRRLPVEVTMDRADLVRLDEELTRVESLRVAARLDEAAQAAEAASAAADAIGHGGARARALLAWGRVESLRGDDERAQNLLFRAFTTAEASGETEIGTRALVALVPVLTARAKLEQAQRMSEIAAARLEHRGLDDLLDAELAYAIGRYHHTAGQSDQALVALRRALEGRRRILGEHHVEVAAVLNAIGMAHQEAGELELSLTELERALAIWTAALGPDHPTVANVLNNLGITASSMGRHDQAIGHHERALAIRRRALAPDHPLIVSSLTNLGTAYQAKGDHARGLEHQQQAAAAAEIAYGEDHPMFALALSNAANALDSIGRFEEALAGHRRAREIYLRALPTEHPSQGFPLLNMAGTLIELGRPAEAQPHAREVLALWRRTKGDDHVHTAAARLLLASALEAQGRLDEASPLLEHALDNLEGRPGHAELSSQTRFTLARVVERSDPTRARELARAALQDLSALDGFADEREEIRRWLDARE